MRSAAAPPRDSAAPPRRRAGREHAGVVPDAPEHIVHRGRDRGRLRTALSGEHHVTADGCPRVEPEIHVVAIGQRPQHQHGADAEDERGGELKGGKRGAQPAPTVDCRSAPAGAERRVRIDT